MTEETAIGGKEIQIDRSGVGHAWEYVSYDEIPANIAEEIAAEIIDGGVESCERFVASNGLVYRW